jgi:hypothetical protein
MAAGVSFGHVASRLRILEATICCFSNFSIGSESSEVGAHEGLESSTESGRGTANQYARSQRHDTSYSLG